MLDKHEVGRMADYALVDAVDKLKIILCDAMRDLADTEQLVNDAFEFCKATRLTPWAESPMEPEAQRIKNKHDKGKEADVFELAVQIIRLTERK